MSLTYRNQLSQLCSVTKEILLPSPFSALIEDYNNFKTQSPESTQALIDEIDLTTQEITKILNDFKMAHDSWQNLRISMTENERANDSQILEKFLQETDYIKVMYDLKRYARKLRNSRNELENKLPKIKPQFDHSHLLPELPPLNPSQNRPFNENTQDSLKPVYTNSSDKSYRNRTSSNFYLYSNPSITKHSDEKLVNNPIPSVKSYTKEMNKFNPLAIPPGFSPLEEINVENDPNDLNNQMNEKIVLNKRLTNEIINKRPISPPPGFTHIDDVCIIKNICNEFTPLQETLNEDNEVKAYNYSKEMPLVLINNPIPDLSPEDPLLSLEDLQQSTPTFTFNSSSETTNNYSAETTIKSSKEILKVKKIINNNSNCVERLLKMSRKKASLKKSRKPQKNLSNPLPIPERSFREFKMAPQNEIIHYTPSSIVAHFNEINPIFTSQVQIRLPKYHQKIFYSLGSPLSVMIELANIKCKPLSHLFHLYKSFVLLLISYIIYC
ncbi:unnamed protein product [Meloidogyne enterolobii]|uniref:Uncharacterized protein n=1 Tax=Meloidogyne enterolobii TaxID=390850 RepID=A0ACB0XW40_MELEN